MAAYCRVSSSSEDQLNSFAAQNIHYTQYITEHEDWRLVDIYADEGISGTSVEKRDDFKRMLADSGRGLIDRILVKSISRFARNTAECLEAIRQFRANGTTIFFEKENIDTARMSSELMAALHAAFSQSESESISGNMRWSYQKRMERGEFNPQSAGFGYCLKEGKLAIVPEEAKIVRFVFESYLSGASRRAIVKQLNATTEGKLWYESAISYGALSGYPLPRAVTGSRTTPVRAQICGADHRSAKGTASPVQRQTQRGGGVTGAVHAELPRGSARADQATASDSQPW